jgi:hypothetical protein
MEKRTESKQIKKRKAPKHLFDILAGAFGVQEFTYEQLKTKVLMPYRDIKEQLLNLIEVDKVKMRFDNKKEVIVYKIIA